MENETKSEGDLRAQKGQGGGNVPPGPQNAATGQNEPVARVMQVLPGHTKYARNGVVYSQDTYAAREKALYEMPPCDTNAEKSVIGGILIDSASGDRTEEVFDTLDPMDFYSEPYRAMYRVLLSLRAEGSPTNDIVVLRDALRTRNLEQECGGIVAIMEVCDFVPTAVNLPAYAKIVADKATIRRTREAATVITGLTHDGEKNAEEIAEEAETVLLGATQGSGQGAGEWVTAGEANDRFLTTLVERTKGNTRNLKSGLMALDQILQGYKASHLHIIAARPAMGKSGLGLTIGDLIAERGKNVALFTMEMTVEDVAERRLSKYAGINSRRFVEPRFTAQEKEAIKRATEKIRTLPFLADDAASLTVRSMRSRLRRARRILGGIDFLIIDYIQLASGESARAQRDKRNEVSEVAVGLHGLAKEFKIPILALAQLNRDCEKREDKRPMLSDLAESGQLEAQAHSVTFLYRPSYYDKNCNLAADAVDEVEAIVAKNRGGLTRTAILGFRTAYTQFVDLEGKRF